MVSFTGFIHAFLNLFFRSVCDPLSVCWQSLCSHSAFAQWVTGSRPAALQHGCPSPSASTLSGNNWNMSHISHENIWPLFFLKSLCVTWLYNNQEVIWPACLLILIPLGGFFRGWRTTVRTKQTSLRDNSRMSHYLQTAGPEFTRTAGNYQWPPRLLILAHKPSEKVHKQISPSLFWGFNINFPYSARQYQIYLSF